MTDIWSLPDRAVLGGEEYPHETDYRVMLKLLKVLEAEDRPELYRWYVALARFFKRPIPREHLGEAMAYLSEFLRCGAREAPGPKLIDWQADAPIIAAEVNKAAGCEVRAMEQVHWWTFLGWFHSIGDGQLATLVAIRERLAQGKKLDSWQQEYYRTHKKQVDLPKAESPRETAEKQRLLAMLR